MGLTDISSFSSTWLDANWRTLERDEGQVFFSIFFIVFFFFFFFFFVFLLVSLLCACVYMGEIQLRLPE